MSNDSRCEQKIRGKTKQNKIPSSSFSFFLVVVSFYHYLTLFHNMESFRSIEELVRELDQPDLIGWKLFAQTSNVKVYRKIDEDVKKTIN